MSLRDRMKEKKTEAGAKAGEKKVARPRVNVKKLRPLVILVVLLGLGTWYAAAQGWFSDEVVIKGRVEADIVSHTAEVSGKLLEVAVELGQEVAAGDVLAQIDRSSQEYAIEQLEQALIQKEAALELAQLGTGDAREQQARSNYQSALSAYNSAAQVYEKALADYERVEALHGGGAATENELQAAELAMNTARNSMNAAAAQADSVRQQITIAGASSDSLAIVSAQAAVDQTESQLAQLREQLEKCTVTASCDGTVMSLNYSAGAMVSPGFDLADISDADAKYLLAYLPEEYLSRVEYGSEMAVRGDGGDFTGTLCYIDVKAQYTPSDMQTAANKNQNSVKIKLRLDADVPLKPGQSAEIVISKTAGA